MDVVAVETAAREAAAHVKTTRSPCFLEARTYRFRAHSMFDAELYRDKGEVEAWKTRDPIVLMRQRSGIGNSEFASLDSEVNQEIAAAVAFAESGTWEPVDQLIRDVYTPPQKGIHERIAS
jgi:pyruvate dehydrogenase E1 component alpha subunit